MAKRPEHRYASAADLSRDLSELAGAFRYSSERPSRATAEPTIPPVAAAGAGGSSDVVRMPEPAAQEPSSRAAR